MIDYDNIASIKFSSIFQMEIYINDDETKTFPANHPLVKEWLSKGNTIDNVNIDIIKADKFCQVESLRKNNQYLPINYTSGNDTYILPNTEKAKFRYLTKHTFFNGATEKDWFDVDGIKITLNKADFKEIVKQIEAAEDAIYDKEFTIKNEINNIINEINDNPPTKEVADLQNYNVSIRWDEL